MSTEPPTTRADAGAPEQRADHARAGDGVGRPADAHACGALGCRRTKDLRCVMNPEKGERVLCPQHARYFVEVTSFHD